MPLVQTPEVVNWLENVNNRMREALTMGDGRYKEREKETEEPVGLDLDIPDIGDVMKDLDKEIFSREQIAKEHVREMEKEEEDVKKGKKKKARQKPKGGTICFCGNPHCNIGEFIQVQGE